jgi:long-chain acyl-CoA synthetase
MGVFKKTYAILSVELNVPVVPVVIKGAYEAMSSGAKKIKWGEHICIEFLEPVSPENRTPEELNELVRRKIYDAKR